nr:putative late blight resistance protein homolog R1B-14 [Ipomoea batatas]
MHFNPIQLGRFTSECSAFLHKHNSDEDREALESVFPAANREVLLPNIVSLSCRLDELLNSQQMERDDCPREYLQLLSHYKLCFPRESLRKFSLSLNLPNRKRFANSHFWHCHQLLQAWERLDDYLIHQWNIQDFKQSVCLLEAFLRDHPPVNKNDRKQIQVLAHKAENLIDSLTSDIYLEYHSRKGVPYSVSRRFFCQDIDQDDDKYLPESSSIHSFLGFESLRYLALASFDDLPPRLPLLRHLQTLYTASISFASVFVSVLAAHIRGLREDEGERPSDEKLQYHLNNLKFLPCLETLKCFFTKQRPLPMPDAFPPNLKNLTLRGCRRSWKEMSILSALPKLEVLKLKDCAFVGSEWELTEEEVFYQLKAMVIDIADLEQWEACSIHFPNHHSLVLKYCKHLNEIPIGIGDINTLQLIELWACSTSAYDSAERIQEEQQNSGNDGLTVRIHRVHNDEWHTYTPGSSSAANSEVEI